ncbi:hypothetical protein TNCV_1032161 [Trichonephila clavipes]|nr:hypothetical protein TNCV_1032161 [Trichonephila clavipes]
MQGNFRDTRIQTHYLTKTAHAINSRPWQFVYALMVAVTWWLWSCVRSVAGLRPGAIEDPPCRGGGWICTDGGSSPLTLVSFLATPIGPISGF